MEATKKSQYSSIKKERDNILRYRLKFQITYRG